MMSTTTSRVQPLLDDGEEEAEGGLRRITGADTSGDRADEALPPVGGSIGVVSHPDGYQYVVKARLAVTVHKLLDVVETSNTFSATVELGLEWEVSEDQWIGCETLHRVVCCQTTGSRRAAACYVGSPANWRHSDIATSPNTTRPSYLCTLQYRSGRQRLPGRVPTVGVLQVCSAEALRRRELVCGE